MASTSIPQDKPGSEQIIHSEHIGYPGDGNNVEAKKVVPFGFGTNSQWSRVPAPFIDAAYDDVEFTNPDGNDNYQTITFKANGSTVRTLTLAYDGSSNVTSIART